ncbi:uncharacterized protein LOC124259540 [Haliotis rubra]|uniref:uncharacterized protein LOC124259540 n=1 Tax=Haliotis rubra TaxID=36100 RepID=UPI001EE5C213|nr:uncharacterized protein LOC124259540 [Haliotis rubra]
MRGLLMLLLLLPLIDAGSLDTSVCSPLPPQPTSVVLRPVIPNTFEVHVDTVVVNKNMTTEVHEHFDDVHNRGMIEQYSYNEKYKAYYDYAHNEFIGMFPDQGSCKVSNLSTSGQRFLFGYKRVNGQGRIFSASGAMHFGANVTEKYLGQSQVRGIWVQGWQSCQYWDEMKASMNVTWFFSDPDMWDTSLGVPQVPVRCHVIGKVQDTFTKSHNFEHFYEFVHFRDHIKDPRVFEMDASVVCPGRINTKPLPNVPDVLSMAVEQVDEVEKMATFTSEWFDSRMKLTKFDMVPSFGSASQYGTNLLSIVRDFRTGIQYVKDTVRGNCSVTALSQDNWDDRMQDPQHVRIATAQEFFHFDNTYSYTGLKSIRGVDCDTWVSLRTDFPPSLPTNSTWEWAFVSANWTSGYDPIQYAQSAIPFQLRITVKDFGMQYTSNIFQYDAQEPSVMNFDVTNCMTTERRRSFRIAFPQKYTQLIGHNRKQFKYAALIGIISAASIEPIRVTNMMITVYNHTAHLSFDLTDLPPVKGDVVTFMSGISLDLAASEFIRSVKQSTFQVNLKINGKTNYLPGVPASLEEMTAGPTPFVTRPPSTSPAPQTQGKVTQGPVTQKPVTQGPVTQKPVTQGPVTQKPVTQGPVTQKPVTQGPVTQKPVTQGPVTKKPVTQGPVTQKPVTQGPVTPGINPPKGPTTGNPYAMASSKNVLCNTSGGGYSAGVMAGVAVVMIVVGGAGGGSLAIFLSRNRRI